MKKKSLFGDRSREVLNLTGGRGGRQLCRSSRSAPPTRGAQGRQGCDPTASARAAREPRETFRAVLRAPSQEPDRRPHERSRRGREGAVTHARPRSPRRVRRAGSAGSEGSRAGASARRNTVRRHASAGPAGLLLQPLPCGTLRSRRSRLQQNSDARGPPKPGRPEGPRVLNRCGEGSGEAAGRALGRGSRLSGAPAGSPRNSLGDCPRSEKSGDFGE